MFNLYGGIITQWSRGTGKTLYTCILAYLYHCIHVYKRTIPGSIIERMFFMR